MLDVIFAVCIFVGCNAYVLHDLLRMSHVKCNDINTPPSTRKQNLAMVGTKLSDLSTTIHDVYVMLEHHAANLQRQKKVYHAHTKTYLEPYQLGFCFAWGASVHGWLSHPCSSPCLNKHKYHVFPLFVNPDGPFGLLELLPSDLAFKPCMGEILFLIAKNLASHSVLTSSNNRVMNGFFKCRTVCINGFFARCGTSVGGKRLERGIIYQHWSSFSAYIGAGPRRTSWPHSATWSMHT